MSKAKGAAKPAPAAAGPALAEALATEPLWDCGASRAELAASAIGVSAWLRMSLRRPRSTHGRSRARLAASYKPGQSGLLSEEYPAMCRALRIAPHPELRRCFTEVADGERNDCGRARAGANSFGLIIVQRRARPARAGGCASREGFVSLPGGRCR